jgi:nucleoside-diphosphate-sugar epimerase
VRGRNSDNDLIRQKLGWSPEQPLRVGIEKTFQWINAQVQAQSLVEA